MTGITIPEARVRLEKANNDLAAVKLAHPNDAELIAAATKRRDAARVEYFALTGEITL